MLAIVRIALSRPYTFVVMAMLIVIFGVAAAIRTPTDIFPNIGIPVVAVVWTYNGLPPDDMSRPCHLLLRAHAERQVNDIEHIESQSLPAMAWSRCSSSPASTSTRALAQITAASQTVLKLLPARHYPALRSELQRFERARSSSWRCPATPCRRRKCSTLGQNFIRPQLATVAGTAVPSPYGGKVLQVQVDLDQDKLQAYGLSSQDVVERDRAAERRHSGRNREKSASSNMSSRSMMRQAGSPN